MALKPVGSSLLRLLRPAPAGSRPHAPAPAPRQSWAPSSARPTRQIEKLTPQQKDVRSDGHLMGSGHSMVLPGTPLAAVSAVLPADGAPKGKAVYVNGIGTSSERHRESLQQLANATGFAMVGVYNATNGAARDVGEVAAQKVVGLAIAPSHTVATAILQEILDGKPVQLFAHSQGTLVLAQALDEVTQSLQHDGLSQKQIDKLLERVTVETFAPATAEFPSGPRYVHNINKADVVPGVFGPDQLRGAKARTVVREFLDEAGGNKRLAHRLDTYLSRRKTDVPR